MWSCFSHLPNHNIPFLKDRHLFNSGTKIKTGYYLENMFLRVYLSTCLSNDKLCFGRKNKVKKLGIEFPSFGKVASNPGLLTVRSFQVTVLEKNNNCSFRKDF